MTEKRYDGPPEMQLTPGAEYYANLRTEKGDMRARLFAEQAPVTVNNFVFLARDGYFDGTTFHRAIKGFVVQGGDPTGTGTGGPGWSIRDELGEGYRRHFRGSLSMAHAGPNTGGSQFFLTFLPTPHLDGRHTVFGRVIEGMDVLADLKRRDPAAAGPADEITRATVLRKRDHEYVPEKLPE